MSYNAKGQPSLVEMIFEGRNKAYGAYQLRLQYSATMLKSLGLVFGSTLLLAILTAYLLRQVVQIDIPNIQILDSLRSVIVEMPPPETEKKKGGGSPPPPDAPAENKNNVAPVIQDTTIVEKPAEQNLVTSTSTTALTSSSTSIDGEDGEVRGKGIDTAGISTPREAVTVDEMPEFEGGMPGISRFIRNNIHYPEPAREVSKGGTIYVRFVVDENGRVSQVTTRNKLGYGLEEEAARVVKLMPTFKKPGKINGHPVKVYFDLPIRFALD